MDTPTKELLQGVDSPAPCSTLELSKEERATIDKVAKHDSEMLAAWKARKEQADEQVVLWEQTVAHSSALAIRATMMSWRDGSNAGAVATGSAAPRSESPDEIAG